MRNLRFVRCSYPHVLIGLLCILLALEACGGNATTPATATIQGTVTAGPTCPVETPEGSCAPRPVSDRKVDLNTKAGAIVETTKTDSAGHYRFLTDPGSYVVHVQIVQGEIGMRQTTPGDVTVGAGQTITLDILLDTGLR